MEKLKKGLSSEELKLRGESAVKWIAHGRWLYNGDPLNFFDQRATGLRCIAEGIINLDRVEQAEADKMKPQGK